VQTSIPLPVNLTNPTSRIVGTSTGQDQGQDENDTSNEKEEEISNVDINTPMLFSLLKSFGSLRYFDLDSEAGERDVSLPFPYYWILRFFVSHPVSVSMI